MSDAHAAARGPLIALSAEHLFYHGTKRTLGWRPDEGISLPAVMAALQLDGQATETCWPYLDQLPTDLTQWVPPQTAAPVFLHGSSVVSPAVQEIMANLDAGMPVVIILMISEAFCEAASGIVEPRASDSDVDWHAVIAVGYAQDSSNSLILIRNSWGEDWGLGGYAWVHPDYLAQRLSDLVTMA